jgi:hypothetical protein
MKKQILLTALTLTLLASAVMTAAAEEVVGTILFEPEKDVSSASGYIYYTYMVDSTGNSFANRQLILSKDMYRQQAVFDTLVKYFVPGQKFVFEDHGRNVFHEIYMEEIIALVAPDGQVVELSEMFSRSDIRRYLDDLDKKLRAQGR